MLISLPSYFNTVGSKEGWTPSQFKSSRESRHGVNPSGAQNLPQTFMDEEDLADVAESQKLGTSQSFTGIGGRQGDSLPRDKFLSLLHMRTETMGVMLLKRMGWRDGQGVGQKVNRTPRLKNTEASSEENAIAVGSNYVFSPDDTVMVPFSKKMGRDGLGVHNSEGLARQHPGKTGTGSRSESSELRVFGGLDSTNRIAHDRPSGRGFGVGELNDYSSGEDDPYELGPKITHIRRVRNTKKTKKSSTKGQGAAQVASPANIRDRSQDGTYHSGHNNLIGGFVRGMTQDEADAVPHLQTSISIPSWWAPSRRAGASATEKNTLVHSQKPGLVASSSATRGRMLGEPGTGQHIVDRSYGRAQGTDELYRQPLQPTRQAAEAALGRDLEGQGPYRSQPSKQARYHRYLEHHAGLGATAPTKPDGMAGLEFSRELQEFYNCVAIFKPMAAPMASRFTAAASSMPAMRSEAATEPFHDKDTPREAARLGMFGSMTRSVTDFAPCSLLCKRFNVRAPRSTVPAGGHGQTPKPLTRRIGNTSVEVPQPDSHSHSVANDRSTSSKVSDNKAVEDGHRSEHASKQVFDVIFGDE